MKIKFYLSILLLTLSASAQALATASLTDFTPATVTQHGSAPSNAVYHLATAHGIIANADISGLPTGVRLVSNTCHGQSNCDLTLALSTTAVTGAISQTPTIMINDGIETVSNVPALTYNVEAEQVNASLTNFVPTQLIVGGTAPNAAVYHLSTNHGVINNASISQLPAGVSVSGNSCNGQSSCDISLNLSTAAAIAAVSASPVITVNNGEESAVNVPPLQYQVDDLPPIKPVDGGYISVVQAFSPSLVAGNTETMVYRYKTNVAIQSLQVNGIDDARVTADASGCDNLAADSSCDIKLSFKTDNSNLNSLASFTPTLLVNGDNQKPVANVPATTAVSVTEDDDSVKAMTSASFKTHVLAGELNSFTYEILVNDPKLDLRKVAIVVPPIANVSFSPPTYKGCDDVTKASPCFITLNSIGSSATVVSAFRPSITVDSHQLSTAQIDPTNQFQVGDESDVSLQLTKNFPNQPVLTHAGGTVAAEYHITSDVEGELQGLRVSNLDSAINPSLNCDESNYQSCDLTLTVSTEKNLQIKSGAPTLTLRDGEEINSVPTFSELQITDTINLTGEVLSALPSVTMVGDTVQAKYKISDNDSRFSTPLTLSLVDLPDGMSSDISTQCASLSYNQSCEFTLDYTPTHITFLEKFKPEILIDEKYKADDLFSTKRIDVWGALQNLTDEVSSMSGNDLLIRQNILRNNNIYILDHPHSRQNISTMYMTDDRGSHWHQFSVWTKTSEHLRIHQYDVMDRFIYAFANTDTSTSPGDNFYRSDLNDPYLINLQPLPAPQDADKGVFDFKTYYSRQYGNYYLYALTSSGLYEGSFNDNKLTWKNEMHPVGAAETIYDGQIHINEKTGDIYVFYNYENDQHQDTGLRYLTYSNIEKSHANPDTDWHWQEGQYAEPVDQAHDVYPLSFSYSDLGVDSTRIFSIINNKLYVQDNYDAKPTLLNWPNEDAANVVSVTANENYLIVTGGNAVYVNPDRGYGHNWIRLPFILNSRISSVELANNILLVHAGSSVYQIATT